MICNESKYNSKWDTFKLEQLGSFSRGISKHRPRNDPKLFEGGGYPLVQTGEIKEATLYVENHKQEYNEFGLNQSKLWDTGTLCITIAANIAETAILAYPMCFPDSVVGFIADTSKSSEVFMYYVFEYIKKFIQNIATGSIQDNINLDYLTSLSFKIPPKEYQNKISTNLLDIDKKILCNKKIIDELESLAKTIYDYWFLQFEFPNEEGEPYKSSGGEMVWNEEIKREIPKGWTAVKVKNCVTRINTGLNPRDNFALNKGDIRYITVKNLLTDGTISFSGCDTVNESARQIIHSRSDIASGDILFASILPLGRCFMLYDTPKTWDINESVFSIRPNFERVTSEYLYLYFTSDFFIRKAEQNSVGSVFNGIRISTLESIDIVLPPRNIIEQFTSSVRPLLLKKEKNWEENQQLESLRDWLLPLLMNGQVGFLKK